MSYQGEVTDRDNRSHDDHRCEEIEERQKYSHLPAEAVGLHRSANADGLDHAVANQRLVVTENFADYSSLLAQPTNPPCPSSSSTSLTSRKGGALAAHLAAPYISVLTGRAPPRARRGACGFHVVSTPSMTKALSTLALPRGNRWGSSK